MYLFAIESFTAFLYPDPNEVAAYFKAAALPGWLFDFLILLATVLTVLSWCYLYMRTHGRTVWMPAWVAGLRIRLYVLFMNRLYVDGLYDRFGQAIAQTARRLDHRTER
jgi:NADH-quinone oxidoreductase subunit L